MNTRSASLVEGNGGQTALAARLVWDAPTRLFHWLLVLCFAGAWLTADSEGWRLLHVTLGYTMAALVAFRLLWGVVGSRHARFASFVRGPRAVAHYLKSLLGGRPEHHAGHNPAGALAIVALLALAAVTTASGWATYNDLGGHWLEGLHEAAATLMLAVAALHVVAVVAASVLHRENLVRAMITGRKAVTANEAIRRARHGVAVVMLASVLGFWWWQWQAAPPAAELSAASPAQPSHEADDDQD
jgi:cytochrome b